MDFKAKEEYVRILGRTKMMDDIRYMDYSCSGIEFEFTGRSASVVLVTNNEVWPDTDQFRAWVAVFIDDGDVPVKRFALEEAEASYTLYETDTPRRVKLRLMKMSEAAFGVAGIKSITTDGIIEPTSSKAHRIEFIGDSITCGYGNEGVWNVDVFNTAQENPWEAYAAKTARYFNADFNLVSWSGIGIISAWTDKDEPNTSEWLMPELYQYTDGGFDRTRDCVDFEVWDNNSFLPELIVINLGTNDASYTKGKEDRIAHFTESYVRFLNQVRSANPTSEILCTLGAMGHDLCAAVETAVQVYVGKTLDFNIHTLCFDVQQESDSIGTDWHPSITTHGKMADKLIEKIKEVIHWQAE